MPSGSHGGSPGSHFGGGSSFGGGGFGGGTGRGNSNNNRHVRPMMFFFFGRHYYIPVSQSSRIKGLFTFAFVLLVFVLLLITPISMANQTINKIKIDQAYYIDMIENAEQNSEYKKVGVIKDKFYNEDCGKWYLTYTFETDAGETVEGYTFSVYNNYEIRAFVIGDSINLAVNSRIVTNQTDSITFDYKDIPLENDGEYLLATKQRSLFIVLEGIFSCGFVVLVVIATTMIIKKAQQVKTDDSTEDALLNKQNTDSTPKKKCKYCGTTINNNNESNCPNCGATLD